MTLGDYRSRWLALVFYPRDFSFVCPTELSDLSAKMDLFAQRDCDILAISPDTIELHQEWLRTPAKQGGVQGLRYPLGSDPSGEVSRAYGVWRERQELPNRGLFLIDPDGVLRYSVVHDLSVGRNATEVLRTLDALKSGGLCPANWTGTDGVLDVESMLSAGRVIGHYRIAEELGRGAFGVVFSVDDLRLGRRVALKVFHRQSSQSESRLIAEARAAASIDQENVCKIFAIDEMEGMLTMVMEYIHGGSLSDWMGKQMEPARAIHIAHQLACGLQAAHEKGVVHGDLKPANILLRESGTPVIVDFGMAKLRASNPNSGNGVSQSSTAQPTTLPIDVASDETLDLEDSNAKASESLHGFDSTITQEMLQQKEGQSRRRISGTPAYMSPEQARGEPLCQGSDIFSLGLIMAEMLTGRHPHQSESPVQILNRLQDASVLQSIVDSVPSEHREHLAAMLAPQPNDRPEAADVARWFC